MERKERDEEEILWQRRQGVYVLHIYIWGVGGGGGGDKVKGGNLYMDIGGKYFYHMMGLYHLVHFSRITCSLIRSRKDKTESVYNKV